MGGATETSSDGSVQFSRELADGFDLYKKSK